MGDSRGSWFDRVVRVSMATSAGHAGRANEDFAGAVPGAAVLLDGAGIPGAEAVCPHGVAWYTHRLGGMLLGRLAGGGDARLEEILAGAIDQLAGEHRGTCDLAHPTSPQATVLMVRVRDTLEYLLLGDTYLVLDSEIRTDGREVAARLAATAPLAGIPPGTPEFDRVREECVQALRARRNQPGGYWLAKEDPRAAYEAVTGSRPVTGAALLSNGAARYGFEVLGTEGPREIIERVRAAEAREGADPDDATVLYYERFDTGTTKRLNTRSRITSSPPSTMDT